MKQPKIGTYVRRGSKGIWKLTSIIYKNGECRYYYGGVYDTYFDRANIIPKYKIEKMLRLTKNFNKGDLIIGLHDGETTIGIIHDIYKLAYENKIWVISCTNNHYCLPIQDGTAVKISKNKLPSVGLPVSTKDILGF